MMMSTNTYSFAQFLALEVKISCSCSHNKCDLYRGNDFVHVIIFFPFILLWMEEEEIEV